MSLSQLLNNCDSIVLGFWADPDEDSSGDEDVERANVRQAEWKKWCDENCRKPRSQAEIEASRRLRESRRNQETKK